MNNPFIIKVEDGDYLPKSVATEQSIKALLQWGNDFEAAGVDISGVFSLSIGYDIGDWLQDFWCLSLFLVAIWLGISNLALAENPGLKGPYLTIGATDLCVHPWLPIYTEGWT